MIKKIAFLSILFFALAQFSISQDTIVINDAWVREVPPGSSVSAAYMKIENTGNPDKLVSLSSEAAEKVELHNSKVDENSIATMELIEILDIPSESSVELKPGGMHIMLIGLKESLVGKETVKLTLDFENAGQVEINVPVKKGDHDAHEHHN